MDFAADSLQEQAGTLPRVVGSLALEDNLGEAGHSPKVGSPGAGHSPEGGHSQEVDHSPAVDTPRATHTLAGDSLEVAAGDIQEAAFPQVAAFPRVAPEVAKAGLPISLTRPKCRWFGVFGP